MQSFKVTPEDKLRAQEYFQRRSEAYDSVVAAGPLKYLRLREQSEVFRLLDFPSAVGRTFLDMGCGSGMYSAVARRAGLHVTAVDVSPGMVEAAKKVADRVILGDIDTFESDSQFDLVLCSGALEFVLEPERAFRNLAQLLAPGGRLVIQVPTSDRIWGNLYRIEKRFSGMQVNLFSAEWFRRQAQDLGHQLTAVSRPLPYNMVIRIERKSH
ncbi:MAG: class I SAM-dependent methyltransferase [Bdellovibrionota bacterium]